MSSGARPIWLWTSAGWTEYIDHPMLAWSDYSGGTVQESNLRVLRRMADEEEWSQDTGNHLGRLATESRASAPTMDARYHADEPEPDELVWYIGSHGTAGCYLRADSARCAEVAGAFDDYPLLDDEDHGNLEEERCSEAWAAANLRERIDTLGRVGWCFLAARHDWSTLYARGYSDDNGAMRDRLLQRW